MALDSVAELSMAIRPFTPTREDPAVLEARTVGRERLLERLSRRFRDAALTQNLAHTLIVGPRGAGKSHILSVALHQLVATDHADRLAVVRLPEDLVGIGTYRSLIHEIAMALAVQTDPAANEDVGSIEAAIAEALGERTLILVLENVDRFFKCLGQDGQHDFRGWIESCRQVLVLATTPLLFDGVQDRNLPWFGSFNIEQLEDLSINEGTELLRYLRPADQKLQDFVATDIGQARLRALGDLTGGSARLWTILSDILTVDLLDQLVPALEGLLEELTTYYQHRLWDLGPNEQVIVRSLGTGHASQTPSELASITRIDPKIVAVTLSRLTESRWVRGRKVAGLDQRTTWYELREPMLRHHFQYRDTSSEPLSLVVDVLRAWYDPQIRRQQLTQAPAGSLQESYLNAAISKDGPHRFDEAYRERSVEGLIALLGRAVAGDKEAHARLPSYLRVLVDETRDTSR